MSKQKILIVEDDPIISMELSHRLNRSGYDVVDAVATGEDAIKKSSGLFPDLILMDIHIDGKIDGIETAEIIRSTQDIPIIYLTAFSDEKTLERAKITEPYGFLIKPFEQRELETTIEVVLYKHSIEKKQKENEQWLETTLKNISDGIITTDNHGIINFVNHAAEEILGTKKESIFGKSIKDVFRVSDYKTNTELDNPVLTLLENSIGAIKNIEMFLHKFDDSFTTIEATTSLIKYKEGKVSGSVLVFRDILIRKNTERNLRRSEERYRAVVEQISDGIALYDIETLRVINSNHAYQKMLGYTEEELKTLTVYDIVAHDKKNIVDYILNVIRNKNITIGERKHKRKDRSLINVETTLGVINYFDKEVLCDIARDITDRKKIEDIIKESDQKYRTLFDSMAQGVVYQNESGKIISANHAACKILGLSFDEMIGRLLIDPNLRSIHEDNSDFPGEEHPSMIALRTGQRVYNVLMGVFHQKEKRYRWIVIDAIPEFRDNESKPYGVFTTFTDITEQKLILDELKKSQEDLKELNATKDKFFSIVAHDLKSPFQGLLGFSNLLAENYDELDDDEVKKISTNIYKSTKNLYELIDHLLSWSRLQSNRMECSIEKLELQTALLYVINLFTPNASGKFITIDDLISDDVLVLADERMLSSILENLISNAIKFTESGGKITISSKTLNDFVEVCISDTGVGISKENLEKLFRIDYSHTSKGTEGEIGTGLGLILCHEMINKLGGDIWAVSEKGKGSSFYITLPKA